MLGQVKSWEKAGRRRPAPQRFPTRLFRLREAGTEHHLIPLITMESLGLKHYPSLGGILRVGEAAGAMLGLVALWRIFDLTSSYRPAFGLCILCATAGAAATLGYQKFSPAATIANEVLSAAGSPLRGSF
jgi:hypothetical protein